MLRPLVKGDLPRVIHLENSVQVVPWGKEAFNICFVAGHLGWVIEIEDKIIGFILVSLKAEECHILNLGVDRDYQRKGYGTQLLEAALVNAKKQGVGVVYLEVRRSNSSAISLYHDLDFHIVGERRNYYSTVNGQEDALVFAKSLLE